MVLERIRTERRDDVDVDLYELRESAGGRAVVASEIAGFDAVTGRETWEVANALLAPTRTDVVYMGAQRYRLRVVAPHRTPGAPAVIDLEAA